MSEFVRIGKASDLPEGRLLVVEVGGQDIVVAHAEGEFYAIGEACSPAGGPLGDGRLDGCEIECPWHGSRFDLRTGEATKPPATSPVTRYVVKVEDDDILIRPA